MLRKILLSSAALALATSAAYAGTHVTLSNDHRTVMTDAGKSSLNTSNHLVFPAVAFNSIATKYPNGLYFCCYGDTISGPSSTFGAAYADATSWTQAKTGKAKHITAGVGYVSGINQATLTLYADSGTGTTPGAILASGVATGLPTFGSCCGTVSVAISHKLVGGTIYWVGISANNNTFDAANFSTTDQVNSHNVAYSTDGGTSWSGYGSTLQIAAEVH